MDASENIAPRIFAVAATLGVAGDLLLRAVPWGINALVAALLSSAAAWALARRIRPIRSAAMWWVCGVVPLLAAVLAWRASPQLALLAVFGVVVSLVAAALAAHGRALARLGVLELIAGAAVTAVRTALGPCLLLGDVRRGDAGVSGRTRRALAVLCGLLLAIPPLLVFGALFAAADAAFAHVLAELAGVPLDQLVSHVVLIALFAWLAAGWLRWLTLDDGRWLPRDPVPGLTLGVVEVGVVLGAVALLFAAFLAVQFTYLFGGEALVRVTTGLTYAEYARSGFFQLLAVACLLVPLLLAAHALVRNADSGGRRVVRWLSALLVVLVFVILGSALVRLRLYTGAYGLTLQRLYAAAFMAWLAFVFLWLALTVLRDRANRFTAGAIVAGLAAILILAAVNPEARVVRANAARAQHGAGFDQAYVRNALGADAVPALLAVLPRLVEADRCVTAWRLLKNWGGDADAAQGGDWRSWNFGRWRARRAVRDNAEMLRRIACVPDQRAPA
ncbi:MAG TPA: DUF4173 domain-containing protein [Rhodanobacteraceae bacterium]|nr:DUF4173 domain-containing protein [Rhodanobacteraceae bacterium]